MDAIADREPPAFLTERCGPGASMAPTQLGPGTWRLLMDGRAIVAKRMPRTCAPAAFRQMTATLEGASIGCPPLLDCVEHDGRWYALFALVDGVPLRLPRTGDTGWDDVFALLERLATVTSPLPPRNIEREWLERVSSLGGHDLSAARLLDALTAQAPVGPPCLAHGDFAPQNLLTTSSGLVLIDWEEAGAASPGFDAGWLLALNRIGAGLRMNRDLLVPLVAALRIPVSNALWFERLGLLRLLWRAESLPASHPHALLVLERIRTAVAESCAERVA